MEVNAEKIFGPPQVLDAAGCIGDQSFLRSV